MKVLELSLDIETDGSHPVRYSMSSLGACTIDGKHRFYRELKPVSDRFDPEYAAVHRLDRDYLLKQGDFPAVAMKAFDDWVNSLGEYDLVTILYRSDLNFDGYFVQVYYEEFLRKIRKDFKWLEFNSFLVGWLRLENRGEVPKFPKCPVLSNEFPEHHALGDALQDAKRYCDVRAGVYS